VFEEVAFIAYYFHWDHAQILNLAHGERRVWCEQISNINQRLTQESRT
jgi:hypothetical protein